MDTDKDTTRHVYEILRMKRMKRKMMDRSPFQVMKQIEKKLTARERDYWWRLSHNTISLKSREHKWRKNEDGTAVSDRCPACKTEKEDRKHYDYDCTSMQTLIDRLQDKLDETITRQDWNLQTPTSPPSHPPLIPHPQPPQPTPQLADRKAIVIAKARWVHHKERCKLANNGRKVMNLDLVMQKLEHALQMVDIIL
jgi:hypothetical protein